MTSSLFSSSSPLSLSQEQREEFVRNGVLVVHNVLSNIEIAEAKKGLQATLFRHGVQLDKLLPPVISSIQKSTNSTGSGSDNGAAGHCAVDGVGANSSDECNCDGRNRNSTRNNDDDVLRQQQQQQPSWYSSAKALQGLSTTNGSGGVLDIFYDDWKLHICQNETLFRLTSELWKASYGSNSCDRNDDDNDNDDDDDDDDDADNSLWYHPYGSFDCNRGYMYIDRIGYRLPTKLAEKYGARINASATTTATKNNDIVNNNSKKTKKKKSKLAIQRSLTPHLDCCPDQLLVLLNNHRNHYSYHNNNDDDNNNNRIKKNSTDIGIDNGTDTVISKWRPIQCFVSLTDNLEPQTGGFEAAKGFHRDFEHWARNRTNNTKNEVSSPSSSTSTLCYGEYTHIRPKEDRTVMDRVQHVSGITAGSAVFWDIRTPHSNSYKHLGSSPRAVVYCSFLPDIPLNRQYIHQNQLQKYRSLSSITDQWQYTCSSNTRPNKNKNMNKNTMYDNGKNKDVYNTCSANNNTNSLPLSDEEEESQQQEQHFNFTPLGRKLMGIDPWPTETDT